MANSSNEPVLLSEEEKKEAQKKLEIIFHETTYICRICEKRFDFDDPCPHTEELREENLKALKKNIAPESWKVTEKKMWEIAKRLMQIPHTQEQQHFFDDE